ncbi:MAG: pseudouridine synthase [Planctomycetota bacterium]
MQDKRGGRSKRPGSARPKRLRVFGQRPTKGRKAGPSKPGTGRRRPSTRVEAQPAAEAGSLWSGIVEQSRAGAAAGEGLVRLNAFLARCGVASRRGSDDLIAAGRVQVDGKVTRELGLKIDPLRQRVLVDGQGLAVEKPTYVLLNKPRGVVCTSSNREQKPRAIDLVAGVKGRLFAVGRLDLDSEGLLLLTNDGAFADRLTHPRYGVSKTYEAVLRGRVEQDELDKARGGVWLSEGRTEGFRIRVKRRTAERSYLEVTIREGKNREIRRVFARLGHPVLRLRRVRIGPLTIRGVGTGRWRFLRPAEVEALWNDAGAGAGA